MPNALYIWIFCSVTICVEKPNCRSGQEDILNFKNRSFELWRSDDRLNYTEVKCPNGKRMISYDDVINIEERLLTQSAFTASVWVNATAIYTPWVIYRGIYRIAEGQVINSTRANNMTHFIDCVQFCSVYNWQYIGLQEDTCYCLSSDALSNTLRISYKPTLERPAKICQDGDIMYCTTRNNNYSMVVYEKDNNTYNGDGECLRSKLQPDSLVSVAPSLCNTQETFMLCLDKKGTYKLSSASMITRRLSYCDVYDMTFVDFHTLNSSKISNSVYNRHYWLNNLRASIFSKPDSGQALHAHCVAGREVNGKIKLQIIGCGQKEHALCIGHNHIFDNTTDEVITTHMNNYTTPDIKKRYIIGYEMYLILPVVGGIFLAVLITVIYRWKCMKYDSTRSSTIHSEVAQTEPRSLGIITNSVRDSTARSEHEYTEVGIITDMAILSNVMDTDGYLVPHQSKSLQKSIVLPYDRDNERVIPMYQMESFNLYQPIEEEGQSCKHLYARITNQAS